MVVGFLLHTIKHGSLKCQFEHSNPFRKPEEGAEFEERKKYRAKLKALWMHSVADDFDLVTDWWFTYKCFVLHGIDVSAGMYAQASLALLVFTVMGTISYLIELYQTTFRHTNPFSWLPLFTVVFEDAPQVLLSMVLSGTFDKQTSMYTLEAPAAFNIATSVYSALMKVSDVLFLNYCYCCKFQADEKDDEEYQ
eukprot:CAMPEP_0201713794 /NCGR_PEP_ID=MMETSP0593-20130828/506_1 /ASSEMBLY_ACC=CAM_ASM_000672 /TAXON_ID=267983 /ORGANISM="Skeletonema japonicum, Strain CCMP2506" /LENGTH=193 /DNA_ID=CAMNT_0048202981 /DNA_START=40 /DNA_END=621 /DNA_ORIENTATION=-